MKAKRFQVVMLSILIGLSLACLLNYFVLDKLLIPDPCYYHFHETKKVFDVFYDLPSSEGGHPVPTTLNIIITAVIGLVIGLTLSAYFRRK